MTRILHIDLTSSRTRVEDIAVGDLLGLGGKALGIVLMERYLDPAVDPLGPDNPIILTPSLLAGYAFSGSDRMGIYTKSPLTGAFLDTFSGGTCARTLRETGWEAVVITGAASTPVRLQLDREGATIEPAGDLWGRDVFATDRLLMDALPKRSCALVIGPAGEHLSALASVQAEQDHAFGRGGLGAVFGSKRLKAITLTSPGAVRQEAGEAMAATRVAVSRLASDSPTAKAYRTFGTSMMVAVLNEAGGFPTDYWRHGTAAHRRSLEAEGFPGWAKVETGTCPPCPMRCRKTLTIQEGPHAGKVIKGPEYETLYAFGGLCMVEQAEDVLLIHERCNRLGMDTISAGNLVGLAIRAGQSGRRDDAPAPGDVPAIHELLEAMAHRSTLLGDLLSQGIRAAAAQLDMADEAVHVKGMEPAGYDPRALRGMALAYATSPRGACHLRATFYKPILGGLTKDLDPAGVAALFVDFEDRLFLFDCLTLCRFYRDFLTWEDLLVATSELAGRPVSREEVQALIGDLHTRLRRLNFAMGLSAADDTLPRPFMEDPLDGKEPIGADELGDLLREYWTLRGWGPQGDILTAVGA